MLAATRWLMFWAGMAPALMALAEGGAPTASKQAEKIVSSADVMQWLLALLLVLAVFLLVVWLLKKSGGFALLNNRHLGIVAGLSLGMREKLVLVRVGEKQLLLGVTPGRIDKLLELEGDQRLFQQPAGQIEADSFAKKLMQVMQGKDDG